jgi:hypothetical protein
MLLLVKPSTAPAVLNVEVGTTTSSERFRGGSLRSATKEEEDTDPAGVVDILVNSSKDGSFRATLSVTTVFVDRLVSIGAPYTEFGSIHTKGDIVDTFDQASSASSQEPSNSQ